MRAPFNPAAITGLMKARWGAQEVHILVEESTGYIHYLGGHETKAAAIEAEEPIRLAMRQFDWPITVPGDIRVVWHDHRLPLRWPFAREKRPYRKGLLCEVSGTRYFHDPGSQYFLRIGEDCDTAPVFDLREMRGFSEIVVKPFEGFGLTFFRFETWGSCNHDTALSQALELLRHHKEEMYWYAVAEFLRDFHERQSAINAAVSALQAQGFSSQQIKALGLSGTHVPYR